MLVSNNFRKSRYCSKLPWYFYTTGQKYHGILTLEKYGTTVNYRGIFITLAPGDNIIKLFTDVSDEFSQQARAFAPGEPFQPSLLLRASPGAYHGVEHLSGALLKC